MRAQDLETDCIKLPKNGRLRMSLCAPRSKCSTSKGRQRSPPLAVNLASSPP